VFRYFAIATVIVLAVAVFATAWSNRDLMRFHLGETKHPVGPPQYASSSNSRSRDDRAFVGDAPWALSALPDCFTQLSESSGSIPFVRSKIPPGAQPVAAGARLSYGPCTIFVRDGEVLVARGADRLRIPPQATLYRAGNTLALYRTTGSTAILRTYDIMTKSL
jgi:hypothetical protein